MTTQPPAPQSLPLFYAGPTVLRFPDHRGLGLRRTGDYSFAADVVAVPLTLAEFAAAGRSMPIVFAQDELAMPLGVCGLEAGRNLLVTKSGGWQPNRYVPAYIRRFPFIAMEIEEGGPRLLGIEATSSLVVTDAGADGGVRLFDEAGVPTERAREAMALCEAYAVDHDATAAFAAALVEHKLLVPRQAEMRLLRADGASSEADKSEGAPETEENAVRATLAGFQVIDPAAFQALSGEVVAEFHTRGWLAPIVLHLASQQSWQLLLEAADQGANEPAAKAA